MLKYLKDNKFVDDRGYKKFIEHMKNETQLDQIKSEIITLEIKLAHAAMYRDAFSQLQLYKELQERKAFKETLEWM
jgi:hypothetical protein